MTGGNPHHALSHAQYNFSIKPRHCESRTYGMAIPEIRPTLQVALLAGDY
jgi:hypothetical protein